MPFTLFSFRSRGRAGKPPDFYPHTRKSRTGPASRGWGGTRPGLQVPQLWAHPRGWAQGRGARGDAGADGRDRRSSGEHLPVPHPTAANLHPFPAVPPASVGGGGSKRGLAAGVPAPCPSFTPVEKGIGMASKLLFCPQTVEAGEGRFGVLPAAAGRLEGPWGGDGTRTPGAEPPGNFELQLQRFPWQ